MGEIKFPSGRGEGTRVAEKDPESAACAFTFINSFIPLFNRESWKALYVPGLTLPAGEIISPEKILSS